MKGVQDRKRAMVDGLRQVHLDRYGASGAELIMGQARFTAPRTVEVGLAGGGSRRMGGNRVFLNLGTRATVPDLPGLAEAGPMTHIELLDLDRLPEHLVVMGGGFVGLELAQAMRRFGSRVTVIERGPQLAGGEDPDVAAAVLDLFRDEGIDVLLGTRVQGAEGKSGREVRVLTDGPDGEGAVTGTDCWSPPAAPRTPAASVSSKPGSSEPGPVTSRSTSTWPPRRTRCGRWASAPAARSSPTPPSTTSGSSWTTCTGEPASPPAAWCRSACSSTRS